MLHLERHLFLELIVHVRSEYFYLYFTPRVLLLVESNWYRDLLIFRDAARHPHEFSMTRLFCWTWVSLCCRIVSLLSDTRNIRYSLRQLERWAEEGHRKPLEDIFRWDPSYNSAPINVHSSGNSHGWFCWGCNTYFKFVSRFFIVRRVETSSYELSWVRVKTTRKIIQQ